MEHQGRERADPDTSGGKPDPAQQLEETRQLDAALASMPGYGANVPDGYFNHVRLTEGGSSAVAVSDGGGGMTYVNFLDRAAALASGFIPGDGNVRFAREYFAQGNYGMAALHELAAFCRRCQ